MPTAEGGMFGNFFFDRPERGVGVGTSPPRRAKLLPLLLLLLLLQFRSPPDYM